MPELASVRLKELQVESGFLGLTKNTVRTKAIKINIDKLSGPITL